MGVGSGIGGCELGLEFGALVAGMYLRFTSSVAISICLPVILLDSQPILSNQHIFSPKTPIS